jgi:hypothetical protein
MCRRRAHVGSLGDLPAQIGQIFGRLLVADRGDARLVTPAPQRQQSRLGLAQLLAE